MRVGRHKKQIIDFLETFLKKYGSTNYHYSDISKAFKRIKRIDSELFVYYLKRMPINILGYILLDLNEKDLNLALEIIDLKKLIEAIRALESDDATDLLEEIGDVSEETMEAVLKGLDNEEKDELQLLMSYEDDQAGAHMQTEVFFANHEEIVKDTIERLRREKNSGELHNISMVFVCGDYKNLVASISLEDLILFDLEKPFKEILKVNSDKYKVRYVKDTDDIKDVAMLFDEYDLSVVPVLDNHGDLLGRITADDIYDIIKEIATEQIYNLAGVDDEVESESRVFDISKKRGRWQFVNMCTAFLAASVINSYQGTIEGLPALAVLMPVVASMGGNTGNQALTVMVRQLALGQVDAGNWEQSLLKEVLVGVANGLVFSFLVGLASFLWYKNLTLSIVMGVAIVLNFIIAGFCGTFIPLLLKRFKADPAVGSSILLTMTTDALGFFVFLGLASVFL